VLGGFGEFWIIKKRGLQRLLLVAWEAEFGVWKWAKKDMRLGIG
jgi:hypothetical protein